MNLQCRVSVLGSVGVFDVFAAGHRFLLDTMVFSPAPTGPIFPNGFESGDTTSWSETIP